MQIYLFKDLYLFTYYDDIMLRICNLLNKITFDPSLVRQGKLKGFNSTLLLEVSLLDSKNKTSVNISIIINNYFKTYCLLCTTFII